MTLPKTWILMTVVLAFAALLASPQTGHAQESASGNTQNGGGILDELQGKTPTFDPATVKTITGEVTDVSGLQSQVGLAPVQIKVRMEKETLPVVLGPSDYLDTQNTKIQKGDQVEVTGSRVIQNNRPMLIATQVKKGDQTLKLREHDGTPLWSSGKEK